MAAITQVLAKFPDGGPEMVDAIFPLVWTELCRTARGQLAREQPGHTLQPMALVNEVYMKLQRSALGPIPNRKAFFALSTRAMSQLLIDHARGKSRLKRSIGGVAAPETDIPIGPAQHELAVLEDIFQRLRRMSERQARVAELRLLAGYTVNEVSLELGISERTVEREWRLARAWVVRALEVGVAES